MHPLFTQTISASKQTKTSYSDFFQGGEVGFGGIRKREVFCLDVLFFLTTNFHITFKVLRHYCFFQNNKLIACIITLTTPYKYI